MVARTDGIQCLRHPRGPAAARTARTASPPLGAGVGGTISVTSRLTATGGYEYTMQVHLTERAGVAVTVTKLELYTDDGWGGWLTVSGPEAGAATRIVWLHMAR